MKFLKLDTGQLAGFDQKLEGNVRTVQTGTMQVLKSLGTQIGLLSTLKVLAKAMFRPGPEVNDLVEGNVSRKEIRLPAVFGNRVVRGIYRWTKSTQACLLQTRLKQALHATDPDVVIIFNGSNYPDSVLKSVSHGRKRVFVEGGFFPGTLQVDPIGLNAANSVPRDPAFYLRQIDFTENGMPQAVNNRASKRQFDAVELRPGYIFVPFQVPSDMQVTLHSPWVRSMEDFLDLIIAAAEDNPQDVFVIKEHPSFKRSVKGIRPDHPRVVFANGNVTSELIAAARTVVTLNSTVGIESLLHEKPVITLGDACYNIDGLVQTARDRDAFNTALRNIEWQANPGLRKQFIGYLWNTYLLHARYDNLPDTLPEELVRRAGQEIIL
jgi:capsular polysaccharide export protein